MLGRIVAIHQATDLVDGVVLADDQVIPSRYALEAAMAATATAGVSWGPGPYSDRARELLSRHSDPLRAVLQRYDQLVVQVAARPDRFVLTHGEPHRGNTITTESGPALIDWDTALLAPPERDLWALIDQDESIRTDYHERTGTPVDPVAEQLYRLWWDLTEVALFITQFQQPHDDTDDTCQAWQGLERHLDPTRWGTLP